MTYALDAPLARALASIWERSSGWPTSTAAAMTSQSAYCSFSQGMMQEVSRPPE
jgi:hypothetical protein